MMRHNHVWWPVLWLALAVLAVYAPVCRYAFINYDDPLYIQMNPVVLGHFTPASWAALWTHFSYGNWQPITMMAHALDVKLFGFHAGAHHAVSMLLHLLNSVLVFTLLRRWSGDRTAALLAALLWALHPQNVDAVAWVSQRKTLLSAAFGLLAALRYLAYRERPSAARAAQTLVLMVLGLMCKGVLVALPLVLWLAVDVIRPAGQPAPAARDRKLAPTLLGLALLSGLVVMVGQQTSHSVVSMEAFPLVHRIGHACDNYLHYLGKIFVPFGLAIHYPPPAAPLPLWHAALAALVVTGLTVLAWHRRKAWPVFSFGWYWFVLLLAPLSGVLATGQAIKTDRFAYLPSIGICLIVGHLLARGWSRSRALRGLALGLIILLAVRTADQVRVWRDNETVYRHALTVTTESAVVRNNLAVHYIATGRMEEAAVNLVEALRQLSDDENSWSNLHIVLLTPAGERALQFHLREIEATRPDDPHYRLVRFQIALVLAQVHEGRRLWVEIEQDRAREPIIFQRARGFLDQYEQRYGPLFPATP